MDKHPVSPLLLRAWHCFYEQEPPYRDPFTTGDAYEDRLDAATLASLARVLRLAGIAEDSLLLSLEKTNTVAEETSR